MVSTAQQLRTHFVLSKAPASGLATELCTPVTYHPLDRHSSHPTLISGRTKTCLETSYRSRLRGNAQFDIKMNNGTYLLASSRGQAVGGHLMWRPDAAALMRRHAFQIRGFGGMSKCMHEVSYHKAALLIRRMAEEHRPGCIQ